MVMQHKRAIIHTARSNVVRCQTEPKGAYWRDIAFIATPVSGSARRDPQPRERLAAPARLNCCGGFFLRMTRLSPLIVGG
jgi:hypothetical protein